MGFSAIFTIFTSLKARILAVVFTGALMIAIDASTISPILYPIQESFGIDERLVTWLFNIEIFALMLATPITAKLSDIFGRKTVYVACVLLFFAGTLLASISHSFEVLLVARGIQGIGATISVLAVILIGDHFSKRRGAVLGIYGVVIGIVYAVGPVISGFLVNFSWKLVFVLNLPIAAFLAILAYRLLPISQKTNEKDFDLKGTVSLGIAIASFAFLVYETGGTAVLHLQLALFSICIASLVFFWYVEKRTSTPILPISLLKRRNTLIASVLTLVGYMAGAGTYFLSTFAIISFGLTYSEGAYMLVPFTIASLAATIVVGKLLDNVGAKPILVAGGIFSAFGMTFLGLSGDIWSYSVSVAFIGIGNASVAGNALYYLFLNETGKSDRASGQAMLNVLLNSGSLMGGAVLGVVLNSENVICFRTVYLSLAFVYIVLALLALGIKSNNIKPPQEFSSGC